MRVAHGASASLRPGAFAEIVGIRSIDSSEQARDAGQPVGTKMYLLEFGDGETREVPEAWIALAAANRGVIAPRVVWLSVEPLDTNPVTDEL